MELHVFVFSIVQAFGPQLEPIDDERGNQILDCTTHPLHLQDQKLQMFRFITDYFPHLRDRKKIH